MQAAIASGRLEGRRALLIGDPGHYTAFSQRLKTFGVRTVGHMSVSSFGSNYEHGRRQTIERCRELHADDILIVATPDDLPRVAELVDALSQLPVAIHLVPVGVGEILTSTEITGIGDVRTMQVLRPPLSAFDIFVKRSFDICAALIGLILLSPLMMTVALAIKLDTRGPILFRQERHGYNNRTISVLKFRSMFASDSRAFVQTTKADPRITRVGRLIRRTSIDELPQLINVLRGEMSIVGPRPHATVHNAMFEERIPPFSRRHNVKPGITGWAQVNRCRGETATLEKMKKRVDHDLFYIDNWSFFFDMKIIVLTFFLVFSRDEIANVY
jgi:Undecaprenyl-phosphate glucose phosphotransferase